MFWPDFNVSGYPALGGWWRLQRATALTLGSFWAVAGGLWSGAGLSRRPLLPV